MKTRIFTHALGVILSAAVLITPPVFAYDAHYRGGHIDHEYSYGGRVDHEYGASWYGNPNYAYGGYGDPRYVRPPYYGNGYDDGYGHPSGFLGYWGKDARHHYCRGHQHHHWL